jgi:hypothetical protein
MKNVKYKINPNFIIAISSFSYSPSSIGSAVAFCAFTKTLLINFYYSQFAYFIRPHFFSRFALTFCYKFVFFFLPALFSEFHRKNASHHHQSELDLSEGSVALSLFRMKKRKIIN